MHDAAQDATDRLIAQWESDSSLLEANQFRRRLDILDQLDASLPVIGEELHRRTTALCAQLEAANAELYQSIRSEIQQGICPAAFLPLIWHSKEEPLPGVIGYDYLDELLSGVLQIAEPTDEPAPTGPENVFYQPTPARHIFALIRAAAISTQDVLVDLGSGLGHVPLLVSACTGARTIGIELDPSFVACARQCAQELNLSKVSFLEQDAQDTDFSNGTVFYLYTPFTGSILQSVLASLQREAATRPIQICSFGPCTTTIAQEPWLEATTALQPDTVTVFSSQA